MTDIPPENVEPATAADIAAALQPTSTTVSAAARLRDRLAQAGSAAFGGNETVRGLYQDTFAQLAAEAETMPGFTTALLMLIERYAFLWASQKGHDLNDDDATRRTPDDYQMVLQRFTKLWEGMLRARDDRQADERFKAQFVTQFMGALAEVCDQTLTPDQSANVQRALLAKVRGFAGMSREDTAGGRQARRT